VPVHQPVEGHATACGDLREEAIVKVRSFAAFEALALHVSFPTRKKIPFRQNLPGNFYHLPENRVEIPRRCLPAGFGIAIAMPFPTLAR